MKRLLLVEDEQIMAKNIAFFLTREGFQVDTAYDGEAALELFAVGQYDLVLLDWTYRSWTGWKYVNGFAESSTIMMLTAGEIFDKWLGWKWCVIIWSTQSAGTAGAFMLCCQDFGGHKGGG